MFFFLLLAPPVAPACVLWLDHAPLVQDYRPPSCPLDLMLPWDWYDIRLIGWDGALVCEWPASTSLTFMPCLPVPSDYYRLEVWLNTNVYACSLIGSQINQDTVSSQCPAWLDEYQAGSLEIRGPYPINPQPGPNNACVLPQVNNSGPLATYKQYIFLENRLEWWGIDTTQEIWQNRYDDKLRGAADSAGIPASLLKGMLSVESQFWPLWTGTTGEVGWLQVTWGGADTALRYDPELYAAYCPRALWSGCENGYEGLDPHSQDLIKGVLMSDLVVTGTPYQASDQAADDLWIYAHVLRAYACMATVLYPDLDTWRSAAIIYNAGSACITGQITCNQGIEYLDHIAGK